MRATRWIGILLLFAWTVPGKAAVKTEEKTQFHMEGMLGRMISLFGGQGRERGCDGNSGRKRKQENDFV